MANNISFPEYPESDLNVILLRFTSGILGKVITAFGAGRPQDHSIRIYGSDKSIENNILFTKDGSFSVFARPLLKRQISGAEYGLKNLIRDIKQNWKVAMWGHFFEKMMKAYKINSREYFINNYPMRLYEHAFAVRTSIYDFINAIRTDQRPKCTLLDSAKTVATCLAGVEAYRTGKVVALEKYWIPEFDEVKKND
jgi:predicted dehydrogenase